jgi:hypothetical protein
VLPPIARAQEAVSIHHFCRERCAAIACLPLQPGVPTEQHLITWPAPCCVLVFKGRQKSTYVSTFFFFLSAVLGVSRQGEFENTRNKIEYVSKKNTKEIFYRGEIFFLGGFLQLFFLSIFLLVKRLSVRGTQKRDKNKFTGSCV